MKHFIWKLFIVTAIALSFGVALPVSADDNGLFEVAGEIVDVDRDLSMIEIERSSDNELITIQGFPFNNLEMQLEDELGELYPEGITIEIGDCVTVEYSEKVRSSGKTINKWESLTMFDDFKDGGCIICDVKEECEGDGCDYCRLDGLTREPLGHRSKHRPNHKPGHGKPKPPGQKGN